MLFEYHIVDVGTIKPTTVATRPRKVEDAQDIVACLCIGGCGQSNQRDLRETPTQTAKCGVLGSKVMPPLRDTMGLVDCKQGDSHLRQPIEEVLVAQTLRTDIQQIKLTRMQPGQNLPRAIRVLTGVITSSSDTIGPQGIDLVLHQGDQRRDYDANARPMQRGDLIAQRFAATCRH